MGNRRPQLVACQREELGLESGRLEGTLLRRLQLCPLLVRLAELCLRLDEVGDVMRDDDAADVVG